MNKNEIIFFLNENEKIVINLEDPLEEVHCCYEAPVAFIKNSKRYSLSQDAVFYNIKFMRSLLKKCLNKELKLHESIHENIGYLYAQYSFYWFDKEISQQLGLVFTGDSWVGFKHLLFAYDLAI